MPETSESLKSSASVSDSRLESSEFMHFPGVFHPELRSARFSEENVFLPASTHRALCPFRRKLLFMEFSTIFAFFDIRSTQRLFITFPGFLFPALFAIVDPFVDNEAAFTGLGGPLPANF